MANGSFLIVMAAQRQAEEERRRREEEEEMTPYTAEELENNWEFKIVRSGIGEFGNPKTFQALLEQEARAGWVLVEKFDNSRVRFKRPISARQNDRNLPEGVDPYRTDSTRIPDESQRRFLLFIILLGILILAGFIAFASLLIFR